MREGGVGVDAVGRLEAVGGGPPAVGGRDTVGESGVGGVDNLEFVDFFVGEVFFGAGTGDGSGGSGFFVRGFGEGEELEVGQEGEEEEGAGEPGHRDRLVRKTGDAGGSGVEDLVDAVRCSEVLRVQNSLNRRVLDYNNFRWVCDVLHSFSHAHGAEWKRVQDSSSRHNRQVCKITYMSFDAILL